MKTARLTILVTPEQKTAIAKRAKSLNISAGDLLRRAVETYKADDDHETVLNALADNLHRAAKEARRAMKDSLIEVQRSLDYFQEKRAPKKRAA